MKETLFQECTLDLEEQVERIQYDTL